MTPTQAATRATIGFPSISLSFPPKRPRIVDRLKMMRNSPQKISAAAIQPGVVAVGDRKNDGVVLGSTEKSRNRGNFSFLLLDVDEWNRTICRCGRRGGTVDLSRVRCLSTRS